MPPRESMIRARPRSDVYTVLLAISAALILLAVLVVWTELSPMLGPAEGELAGEEAAATEEVSSEETDSEEVPLPQAFPDETR